LQTLCGRDGGNPWLPSGNPQPLLKSAIDFYGRDKSTSRKSRADMVSLSARAVARERDVLAAKTQRPDSNIRIPIRRAPSANIKIKGPLLNIAVSWSSWSFGFLHSLCDAVTG
jgi:hypothetical protein